MKGIFQIGIVFAVCLAGELLSAAIPLPVPTSVLSLVLLLALLLFKVIKLRHIECFGDFLLKNMAFFFIPASVGIIEQFDLLKDYLVPFLVICCVSTVITFAVTAFTVRGVMALQRRIERPRHE